MDLKSYLRPVNSNDINTIFRWSNDSLVRSQSFSSDKIKYNDHVRWFNSILNSSSVIFCILNVKNEDVGQIRLKIDNNRAVISYSIACEHRKKGFGKLILMLAEEYIAYTTEDIEYMKAEVKKDNTASNKLFIKLGYTLKKVNNKCNIYEKIVNGKKGAILNE